MMNFRVVSQALLDTLGAAAACRFRVIGYRGQGHDAEELRGIKQTIQAYYSSGDFPKSAGRQTGATQHSMTFNIDLSVSAAAKVNLSVINNPGATPTQIASALSAMQEAAYEADVLLDELAEYAYQILMDGRNFDLGLSVGVMSKRWVDRLTKGDPQPSGDLLVLTGQLQYTCQTVEEVVGDTGTPVGSGAITTTIDIIGDDVEQTMVTV